MTTNDDEYRKNEAPRRDVPRRGDRNRDNSSFGERRGRDYRAGGQDRPARGEGTEHPVGDDARRGEGAGPRRGERPLQAGRAASRGEREERRGGDRRGGAGGPRRSPRSGAPRKGHGASGGSFRNATRGRESELKDEAPQIPEGITPQDLEPEIRQDLRTLNKENADAVACHLVASMWALDENPQLALRHARAAKARAGRIGVVREMLGVIAYSAKEWAEALAELRAARRIQGGPGLLSLMADAERGLGRPEKAIELARSEEADLLDAEDRVELKIVEAGARMDLDQVDAALVTLEDAGLSRNGSGEQAARLAYAYADVLAAAERTGEARAWFESSLAADPEATDAEERLAQLG